MANLHGTKGISVGGLSGGWLTLSVLPLVWLAGTAAVASPAATPDTIVLTASAPAPDGAVVEQDPAEHEGVIGDPPIKSNREKEDERAFPWLPETMELEFEVESTFELERNLDLTDEEDADVGATEQEFVVSFAYEPSDHFEASISLVLGRESFFLDEANEEAGATSFKVEEASVAFADVPIQGFEVEIGRKKIRDFREWLYDRQFDSILLAYEFGRFSIEGAFGRVNIGSRDRGKRVGKSNINNYLLAGEYDVNDSLGVSTYLLVRDDRAGESGRPVHVGLRANGLVVNRWKYWIDLGHVRGNDGEQKLRGFAVDAGVTRILDVPLYPSLTLSYAWGSGDRQPEDGVNRAYRQTGLHDNVALFNGLAEFRYYGEVFDPDLSNMHILTAGAGIKSGDTASIDVIFHSYHQDKFADELRRIGVDGDLTSGRRRKHLGNEVDLVAGFCDLAGVRGLNAIFAIGYFMPGKAFSPETDDSALFGRLEFAYSFPTGTPTVRTRSRFRAC